MAISIKDLDGGIGNAIIASGIVTGQNYIEKNKKHLTQDKEKFKKYSFSLNDYTEVTQFDVSNEDIEFVIGLCIDASKANRNAIVAIVVDKDFKYGIGRMFSILAEETGWEIMVYRSRVEAEAWIKKRVKEKFGIDGLKFG